MGAKCCCNDRAGRTEEKRSDNLIRKHSTGSDGRTPSSCSNFTAEEEDLVRFDAAFKNNDIKEFVSLLDSYTLVHGVVETGQPWVTNPTSVGALVAAQLATLAQDGDAEKNKVREEGAMPKFVEMLKSEEVDRREVSALALSHLTQSNSENALEVYRHGGMSPSFAALKSEKLEMKSCARTIIRNMAAEGLEMKLQFLEFGGMGIFLEQFKTCENTEVRCEVVLDIQDIVEDSEGNVVAEVLKEFKERGGFEILQVFEDSPDDELREAVSEFLLAMKSQDECVKF